MCTLIFTVCARDHWVRWSESAILALTLTTHNSINSAIVAPLIIIAIAVIIVPIVVIPRVVQVIIGITAPYDNIIAPIAAVVCASNIPLF